MTSKDSTYYRLWTILALHRDCGYPPMIVDTYSIAEYQKAIISYLELWT